MFEVHIFIPLKSNDGKKFPPSHHVAFEAFVLVRFEGITRLAGTAAGHWRDGSKTYSDTLIIYVIALNSIAQGHLVAEVVAFAKVHYGQEAIYVRYLGIAEIL